MEWAFGLMNLADLVNHRPKGKLPFNFKKSGYDLCDLPRNICTCIVYELNVLVLLSSRFIVDV